MPPVRSGHMQPSSARHRHSTRPKTVLMPIAQIAVAPMPCTTYGAMPVTRIVPARPMTNAPHQFVPLTRPFSGIASSGFSIAAIAAALRGGLEQGEVAAGLPVADHRVPGLEFLPLDLGVVVDVVAVGRLAERVPQHLVGDEGVGG